MLKTKEPKMSDKIKSYIYMSIFHPYRTVHVNTSKEDADNTDNTIDSKDHIPSKADIHPDRIFSSHFKKKIIIKKCKVKKQGGKKIKLNLNKKRKRSLLEWLNPKLTGL